VEALSFCPDVKFDENDCIVDNCVVQYIWCDPDKVFTGTLANYIEKQEIKDRNNNRLITLHTGEAQSPDRNGFIERYIGTL
tara:strand:- start:400 stop:642 length:243 start_codon:yes stop_codon:yes gene_type:complete